MNPTGLFLCGSGNHDWTAWEFKSAAGCVRSRSCRRCKAGEEEEAHDVANPVRATCAHGTGQCRRCKQAVTVALEPMRHDWRTLSEGLLNQRVCMECGLRETL